MGNLISRHLQILTFMRSFNMMSQFRQLIKRTDKSSDFQLLFYLKGPRTKHMGFWASVNLDKMSKFQ